MQLLKIRPSSCPLHTQGSGLSHTCADVSELRVLSESVHAAFRSFAPTILLHNVPDDISGVHTAHMHILPRPPVRCADFVVLNKTDMLDEAQRDELTAIIASLNPLATVIPCTHGKVQRCVHAECAHYGVGNIAALGLSV